MKKIFFFLAALAVAFTANAKVTTISPDAENDALRLAVHYAEDGDIIEMTEGTYVQCNNGYVAFDGKSVTVKAAEGANVVLQLQVPITLANGGKATLQGIKIDASRLLEKASWYEHVIYANDATEGKQLVMDGCELYGFGLNKSAIYSSSSNTLALCDVKNCYFHDNMKSCFFFEGASIAELSVVNSTFANIATNAESYYAGIIDPRNPDAKVTVDHCTFYNCLSMSTSYAAVTIKGLKKENVVISNNIFMLPEATDGQRAIRENVEATNCMTFNYVKDDGGIYSTVTQTNCFPNVDPKFVDAANGNYTFTAGSPALGAGTNGTNLGDPRWNPSEGSDDNTGDEEEGGDDAEEEDTTVKIYVSPSGDDDYDGKTPETAKATLKKAYAVANAGETIIVANGEYESSSITFDKPGVTVKAAKDAKPVINATSYMNIYATTTFVGLTFDGLGSAEHGFAVKENTAKNLILQDCEVRNYLKNLVFVDGTHHVDSLIIDNCLLHHSGRVAVYVAASSLMDGETPIHGCDYFQLTNSTVYEINSTDYSAGAIDIRTNGDKQGMYTEIIVDHVTIYNAKSPGDYGAIASYKSENVKISNTIVMNDAEYTHYSFRVYGASQVSNCLSYNCSGKSGAQYANCLPDNTDPQFVDATNGNFALAAGSPAIGAGTDGTNLGDPRWKATEGGDDNTGDNEDDDDEEEVNTNDGDKRGDGSTNRYVSAKGDDANDGKTPTTAKATIKAAMSGVQPGDTVFVAAGTYSETITIKDGIHVFGGYNETFTVRNTTAFTSVIDGTEVNKYLVTASGDCQYMTVIDGLTLQNAVHTSNGGAARLKANCHLSNCIVELCETTGAGGAVHNVGGIVENCIIRGNKGRYAAIWNESNGIVRNCLIHNNEPSVADWPNSGGIYNPSGTVYNNTLVCNFGSAQAGIHSESLAYNNVLWNNKSDNDAQSNYIATTSNGSGDNAADYKYGSGSAFSVTLAVNNYAENGPQFIAPTSFAGAPKTAGQIAEMRAANFNFLATSPIIDKGRAVEDLTSDLVGTTRPLGNGIDQGCYEFNPDTTGVAVSGLVLNTDTARVYPGDTTLVVAILLPNNASNRNVTWTIENPTIATVNQGSIIGLVVGQTFVTATTEDGGFTATAVVDVVERPIPHKDVLEADVLYHIEDYTIPSFVPFMIAKEAARADSTPENLAALKAKIAELIPYQQPYDVVVNINGDPQNRMAFAWFTNEKQQLGQVQLVAKANATEADFAEATTITATSEATPALPYAVPDNGVLKPAGMTTKDKHIYTSHKAIATDLTPNTTYTYRVGTEGYWSEMGIFTTAPSSTDDKDFTFIYMSDSHILTQKYVDKARRTAIAAIENVPEAKFCAFPGDFVDNYCNSEWEWERLFEEALRPVANKMPIVPTDGNHDVHYNPNYSYHFNTDNTFKTHASVKPYADGTTYSFMYGDVLFLVFSLQDYWRGDYDYSTLTSVYLQNDIANWFRDQIEAYPNAKMRVGLVHYNIFSGSSHQDDEMGPLLRASLLPIMKECDIDIVLQGHDHCYEVMGPVDNNVDAPAPIMEAIAEREVVSTSESMSGYKGGTYTVDNGTLYFIGATCGDKRYDPYTKEEMEADINKHKVENYFDIFTGMFCQPKDPSYTALSVKGATITFKSYKVDENGNSNLFNTFVVKRTEQEGSNPPTSLEQLHDALQNSTTTKVLHNGQVLIVREGAVYTLFGQQVK